MKVVKEMRENMEVKKGNRKNKLFRIYLVSMIFLILLFVILVYGLNTNESPNNESCLSLTFDDKLLNHYEVVYPLLKERNFSATFFVIANLTEFEGRPLMKDEQLIELQNNGFEIGSHSMTHPLFSNLSLQNIGEQLEKSKISLEEINLTITSFAIPYRDYNNEILKQTNIYYEIVRDNYNFNFGGFISNANSVHSVVDIGEVCSKIRIAKEKNYWLILIFHAVEDNPRYWDISAKNFKKVLDCADETGISVKSLRDCKETTGTFNTLKFIPEMFNRFYKPEPIGY